MTLLAGKITSGRHYSQPAVDVDGGSSTPTRRAAAGADGARRGRLSVDASGASDRQRCPQGHQSESIVTLIVMALTLKIGR